MILRPRGVRLLPALFVVLGVLLAAAPAQAADDDFAFRGTYLRTAGNGCDAGDVPIFGGHYSSSGNPLLRWHPALVGARGTWQAVADSTLNQDVICLDFADAIAWRIVEENWTPGSSAGAGATCPIGEHLLGGGFYFSSGLQGSSTANAPDGDRTWGVEGGGDPRATNTAYAVCGKLPTGIKTYSTSANRASAGSVTANCAADDLPIAGGWDAASVRASHPEAHGWTVKVGNGGGFARAVCLTGLEKRVESRVATASAPYLSAECADDEFAVNAGWDTGAGMNSLRIFLPWNNDSNGWTIGSNEGDSSSALAYVLCAKVLPPPAPSWTVERLPWSGALGLAGLAGLGAVIVGRGRLSGPITAVVGTGAGIAIIGAIGVGLIPIDAGALTPPGDSDAIALPSGTPTATASASASASPTASASASATASESASASPSASATSTSATPKPSAKPTPKKTTSSAAAPPPPATVIDFRVSPTYVDARCNRSNEVGSFALTLDNSGSNEPVSWTGSAVPKDGNNWATLSAKEGSVAAGSKATLTVNPINPNACNIANFTPGDAADFTVRIQADGKTINVTVHVTWIGQA